MIHHYILSKALSVMTSPLHIQPSMEPMTTYFLKLHLGNCNFLWTHFPFAVVLTGSHFSSTAYWTLPSRSFKNPWSLPIPCIWGLPESAGQGSFFLPFCIFEHDTVHFPLFSTPEGLRWNSLWSQAPSPSSVGKISGPKKWGGRKSHAKKKVTEAILLAESMNSSCQTVSHPGLRFLRKAVT